ncbi:MAG: hypothetical protein V4501_11200 [Pseudomonadota bacterium]
MLSTWILIGYMIYEDSTAGGNKLISATPINISGFSSLQNCQDAYRELGAAIPQVSKNATCIEVK